MDEHAAPSESNRAKRRKYRDTYEDEKRKRLGSLAEAWAKFGGILDVLIVPSNVDMESFSGTEHELAYAMEQLYANDGRDFNPEMQYPPSMLQNFGKDYALHAQGIYYRRYFSENLVMCNRKVWTPSLSENEMKSSATLDRQARAEIFASHSRNNETWYKSEYAWEADAWSNVFRPMRDDPCLAIDKHDYMTTIPDIDPILYKPIPGKSSFVKRTPDATFGLATFTESDSELPQWTSELLWERLEQLMLHPKYGLVTDPSRMDISLAFPFMVYEAKGWSGDCRVARRQACSAAAYYLDMLDELARQPGPVGSPRPYQTETSHNYQVFALTSFGAYWHLLVGYRRPRLAMEHADAPEMSENIYVFQKLWSGHVTNKEKAYQLLDLVDQIHLWAITDYRTFMLEHLRPWHKLCQDNYLLEWDSIYDTGEEKKRKRRNSETEDLNAPAWVSDMNEQNRRKFQSLAKLSLEKSLNEDRLIKGKAVSLNQAENPWFCVMDGCTTSPLNSDAEFLNHLVLSHDVDARAIANITRDLKKDYIMEGIRARQKQGIMATDRLCPPPLKHLVFGGGEDENEAHFVFEDVFVYDRMRSGYKKVPKPESADLNANNI